MRHPWESEHGLLHPVNGYAAEYIRGRQGTSQGYGLMAVEDRVREIERMLTVQLRGFRGIRLEDPLHEIIPGPDGWLQFSTDEYLQWTPENTVHHGRLEVDLEALAEDLCPLLEACIGNHEHCFPECTSTTVVNGFFSQTVWQGYLQHCRDNGNGTQTCVAIPYRICTQEGACA